MAARRAPKLSGSARAEALRRLRAGERMVRVAADYGVSDRRLRAAAREAGIPSRLLSPAQRAVVVARYQAGEPSHRIAADMGCTQRRVQQLVRAAGCSRPRSFRPRADRPTERGDA